VVWLHGWTGYVVMGLVADKLLRVLRELGGWDLSTATFNGSPVNSYYVGTEDSFPSGVFFKDDGSKMYVTGRSGATVEEYTLTTNWDVSTASLSYTLDVSGQDSYPNGLFFKDDGSKMYVVGLFNATVYQYGLSTDWDLSSATYDNVSKDVSAQDDNLTGLFFRSNGEKMYITGLENDSVYEYTLSPAWSITSASLANTYSVSSQETSPNGLFFKDDGSKMYVVGYGNDKVYEYDLGTNWSLASVTYNSVSKDVSAQDDTSTGLFFRSNGEEMYVVGASTDRVYKYTIPTVNAWDVSSASFTYPTSDYFSVLTEETSPTGLFFKDDGTKMYITGTVGDDVNEYSLSTEWNISTASYVQNFSVSTEETIPQGLFFKNDGTKMYIIGSSGDDVNEYSLSTGWDISTASYSQNFSVSTEETSPTGLFFKPDGAKMYITGSAGDDVNEYSLSTVWDISTASYVQNFSISAQDFVPQDLFFKYDGTKMYIVGENNNKIYEYSLSTAWDISTASYLQDFSVGQQEILPRGLFFKPNGAKMYIAGSISAGIWAYSL